MRGVEYERLLITNMSCEQKHVCGWSGAGGAPCRGSSLSLSVSLPVSEVLNTKKHARVFARMVVFDRHVHVRH